MGRSVHRDGSGDGTEIAWLQAAVSGDGEAFASLVRRYHSPIYGFLFRMHPEHHTIQDLVQETFMKAWRELPRLRRPDRFKPWLFAIARNLLTDHMRSAAVQREIAQEAFEETGSRDPRLTDLAQRHVRRDALGQALSELTDLQRTAVVLRYFHDMSLAEMAEALEVPLSTAKTRLYTGIRRLSELLEDHQGDLGSDRAQSSEHPGSRTRGGEADG